MSGHRHEESLCKLSEFKFIFDIKFPSLGMYMYTLFHDENCKEERWKVVEKQILIIQH